MIAALKESMTKFSNEHGVSSTDLDYEVHTRKASADGTKRIIRKVESSSLPDISKGFSAQEKTSSQTLLAKRDLRRTIKDLNQRVNDLLIPLLNDLYPNGMLTGEEYSIGNIRGDTGDSMHINVGSKVGVWYDFATGDSGRGAVSLIMGRFGVDELEAIAWLNDWLGMFTDVDGDQGVVVSDPDDRRETRYVYRDRDGLPVVESVRIDWIEGGSRKKKFAIYDPTTSTWTRPGGLVPCYGTDIIVQFPNDPIVVVEGEKAAEALISIGVLATTSLGGARSPGRTDWSALSGRIVFIWPDNDTAGQRYCDDVVQLVKSAGALSIRLIQQDPSWPEKHDAADLIGPGMSPADLKDIFAGAQVVNLPTVTSPKKLVGKVMPGDDLSPLDVALEITRRLPEAKTWNETTWVWTDGLVYRERPDTLLRSHAQKLFGSSATASGVKNAVELFKNHTAVEENPMVNLPSRTVFANDTDLVWDGAGFRQERPSPQRFNTVRLPWAYVPDASCNRFLGYLDEVFLEDPDKHEKINLIQEIMGYCLVFDASWPIIAIMYGAGANGKSVLIDLITALLGDQNITSVSPKDFKNAFYRHKLVGRLANVVPELDAGERLEDATLKQLSSGDIISVEQKYKTPTEARVYATNIFASNSLPYSRDLTHGLRRRMRFIPFNRIFKPSEQDPRLTETIIESEMPGILAFALAGLGRLYRQSGFTNPPSSASALDDWAKHVDHVQLFLEDECVIDESLSVTSAELFAAYCEWASLNGISRRHDAARLSTNIKSAHPQVKSGRTGQSRRLDGIGLRQATATGSPTSAFREKLAEKVSVKKEGVQ